MGNYYEQVIRNRFLNEILYLNLMNKKLILCESYLLTNLSNSHLNLLKSIFEYRILEKKMGQIMHKIGLLHIQLEEN